MHLSDGIITSPALIGGTLAAAAAGSAWGLYRLKAEDVPRTAMMSAEVTLASLTRTAATYLPAMPFTCTVWPCTVATSWRVPITWSEVTCPGTT